MLYVKVQLISVQIFESSAVLLETGKQESIAEVEVQAVGTLTITKNRHGACTLQIVLSSCYTIAMWTHSVHLYNQLSERDIARS